MPSSRTPLRVPKSPRPPRLDQAQPPRVASSVTAVLEFRGRVLGLTDRAQLLEFHLSADPPNHTIQMLPTAGLPDATTFDKWRFGLHLVAAGDRLLLGPKQGSVMQAVSRVKQAAVYGLDMAQMRWEEVDDIGAYSLFVDCAGRSAAACLDVGSCGVEENRVYVPAPGCHTWWAFPPGWEVPLGGAVVGPFSRGAMEFPPWPSKIWLYPRLFFG